MTDSLEALADAVARREVSARELVRRALGRIDRDDEPLHAFVHVDADAALAAADEIDAAVARGEDPGPLAGIPFGVKDLDDAAGMPTGKGSRWFQHGPPAGRDDIHVARLRAAGAIPVGKTATPELGADALTASPVHGITRNPWDAARTPGGSSGGSSAAVAAGMVPFCTASDGGGSIRSPAGFTSLPGLRPAYGRVPTFGSTHVAQNAVCFALAATSRDTALLLDLCAGPDRRDRTSLPPPPASFRTAVDRLDLGGMRVAYTRCFGLGPVEAEVDAVTAAAFARLCEAAGLEVVDLDVRLPFFYEIYARIEGVDRWIGLPEGVWPERADELTPALRRTFASNERARLPQLGRVYTERRHLEQQVAALFEEVDLLVTPTTGVAPFPAGGPVPDRIDGVEVHPFVGMAQPVLASLCNLPSMSVPAGLTTQGLPVGLLVNADRHREDVCLRLARIAEDAWTWPRLPALDEGFLSASR